jgi:hypothetical protein
LRKALECHVSNLINKYIQFDLAIYIRTYLSVDHRLRRFNVELYTIIHTNTSIAESVIASLKINSFRYITTHVGDTQVRICVNLGNDQNIISAPLYLSMEQNSLVYKEVLDSLIKGYMQNTHINWRNFAPLPSAQ